MNVAAGAATSVDEVAMLFTGLLSCVVEVTTALLMSVPVAVGVTTMVIVALEPLAMFTSEHVTTEVNVHEPWLGVAETNDAAAGSESTIDAATAPSGPA